MELQAYPLNCTFLLDGISFHILQISRGTVVEVPSHSHGAGNYEIHYLPEGYGTAVINGSRYDIVPNTLYITGPLVEHSQSSLQDTPLLEYCINLQAEKISNTKKLLLAEQFFSHPVWYGLDRQNLLPLLLQIFRELESKELGYASQLSALLTQCIIALIRNYGMAGKEGISPKNRADSPLSDKTILAENYFLYEYSHLSLEELSLQLGFSARQTQRFLLEHFGKTFREKKEESRMAAALLLLTSSPESITAISEKLGFASVEYFSSSFKKYYGKTPRDYRKDFN